MGKRKYDSDKDGPAKKTKTEESAGEIVNGSVEDEQPQNEERDENENKALSNQHGFHIKHFRKELAAKQGQTMALTQFLQVCLNPDSQADYLLEYLKAGGNSHEILRQISQDNKKNLTLATPAFHLFHLIILKVQSSMPHMISVTEEACRYFLNTFMPTVEIMISENSGPRHRKIVLKLLTSMVTLNPDLGIEVLNQAPLTPKHLQYIVEKSNYKEKDNVRTAFVHFMTSFLVDGHLPLIKALLEKQGLLALVIPGLVHDEAEAVMMFLNILKKNVIDNAFISKSVKLKTFSHQVLHNIFKVFSWKGPPEMNNDVRNESRPVIMELLSDIILTLFTSHRLGLYFIDSSLGTADANKNQNLYKAILTLKRPWENDYECKAILEIIYKCPDLHRAIIHVIEQSFEPQHSPIWERTTDFVIKLLNKMKPEDLVPRMSNLSSLQMANFVRFISLPVPLLKSIQGHLGKDHIISLYCIKILVKMLQTLRRYIQILELNDKIQITDLKNKLDYFIPKHLPTPSTTVKLVRDVIDGKNVDETSQDYKLPKPSDTDSLISLVDLLLLYHEIHPAFFETLEGTVDMKKLLEFSSKLSDGNIAMLKFKVVSLWLTLDTTAISVKNPMFKDLFLIMLEVYTSDNDNTWMEAKDTLYKFFKNTSIFEADEDEIHLILYTLRNSKVTPISTIGDIVEYVLANGEELTDYVKNQIVHFEITDEGTEASLDKLFNDLMENRNTEDSIFLESKVPSPFIVGCMQYIQNNKETKKNLKQFLSLYIANLLHCNYSPELTEVLIGDSKLDIRNYVASWISQSISLPEGTGKDNILRNISKYIIDNDDISLKDIFSCIEETSVEESDFSINGIAYKVNVTDIDSSELLIWAKYLIFDIVRLSSMNLLTEDQQIKITVCFDCIIAIGRKLHLIDICRIIILNLFKNPHFLKVYRPLDFKKEESGILATKFALKVVTRYQDIVNYLNNRHKLLKSYQQKNYNEIVKAFVKIGKKKKVNSAHTVQVLEVIGLAKEDDFRVFSEIFSVGLDTCIKDDKEPSIVLDLLRVLIEKYSKSLNLELPQGTLRKSMKLYLDLLTSKDVTPNLTELENSLIQFFENKPHHCVSLTEDIFKKFYEANSIRKSTSQLASVLLKYNVRFCNVFKEQTIKPEVLSQRELTLPLGNAALHHHQFVLENKPLLTTIYNEYKSNIVKILEKPHKSGQIYVSCWKLIRKLVLECMELQDCVKLFVKNHKFETVESSHIHLLQSVFLKICLEDGLKKEHLLNYYFSMLHLTTITLKEAKEACILNDIITNIYTVTEVCKTKLDVQTNEFQKVTESAVWQNFCKAILKYSLKVRTADQVETAGPQLLHLLTILMNLFYPADHDDVVALFDMVTSHSEFLNVMLSHHSSDIKSRLIELIYVLITKNNSVMKQQQIPVYLSAYHATRSPCDRLLLTILHYYESKGQPVNEYKPYVWGDSAANYYAVRKNRTSSLWAHPTPNQVLNLFEKDVIERTVRHFPVTQKLDYHYELPTNIDMTKDDVLPNGTVTNLLEKMFNDGALKPHPIRDKEAAIRNLILKTKYNKAVSQLRDTDIVNVSQLHPDEGIYDPVFLFPLLSHLLAPGSIASCFKLLRTGLLSVPVMALSSHCPVMRSAAYHVLHRFYMLLETETKHKNDKLFLTDFINTLRQSLTMVITQNGENGKENAKNPRLPAVGALYLAKALLVSTAPFDPLYKPVNNFFIAKQFVDLTVVPDFLSLFHDTDVEAVERRQWILDVIRDGTKTMTDVNAVFKTMCLKMIMDFSTSVLSDRKTQEKVIGVLTSIVAIPRAFEILIEGYGLISWLHCFVRQLGKDATAVIKRTIVLIENMIRSMSVNAFARNLNNAVKNGKASEFSELKVNKEVEHEILVLLHDLLQHIDGLEKEVLGPYVKVYRLISKRTLKLLTKKQILCLVSKGGESFKDSEAVTLIKKAITKNDSSRLNARTLQSDECLLVDLTAIVKSYLI